jgi:hypothetical protein
VEGEDKMDGRSVYNRLQPLNLIADDKGVSGSRKYIEQLVTMRRTGTWDQLDAVAEIAHSRRPPDPYDPILHLHLANAYLQTGKPGVAQGHASDALDVLECRADLTCRQNQAVAALYLGLSLHYTDYINDALYYYGKARDRFKSTEQGWRSHPQDRWRADKCQRTLDRLEACLDEIVRDLATRSRRTGRVSRRRKVKTGPLPPASTPMTAPPQSLPAIDLAFLGALMGLMLLVLGYGVFVFKGSTALIVYGAVVVTMATIAVLVGRASTQGGFVFDVPSGSVLIVKEGSDSILVGPEERWILIPWLHKAQFLVPLAELTLRIPGQKVALGQPPDKDASAHVFLTIEVCYRVFDPIAATGLFYRGQDHGNTQKEVVGREELKETWDSQIRSDLTPLLVDYLWGSTVSDCCSEREQIQEDLGNELAAKTRLWGSDVSKLTILEIAP